jgi:hypothetical protein
VVLPRVAPSLLLHDANLSIVDERGWGWPVSEARRAQLIQWLVRRSAEEPDGVYIPIEPFYSALPDQSANTYVTALDDMNDLDNRGLINLANSYGSIGSLYIFGTTPEGRAVSEALQAARGSRQRQRSACRDAMVDWLYSVDAVSPPGVVRDAMLQDPRRNSYFGEPFSADDLDAAAAWLQRQGLAGGAMIEQAQGPVVLYLTDAGVRCAEEFGSNTEGYVRSQQHVAPGPIVNIGTNRAPLQVAGDHARQTQNLGAGADDLRLLITGIAEIVRALVPDVADADAEVQAALAAVSETRVDQSALVRFRNWTVSTVRAGATGAAVAAVSSAVTTLLIEAARLASRLG